MASPGMGVYVVLVLVVGINSHSFEGNLFHVVVLMNQILKLAEVLFT
jgi:hypothetical protein